MTPPTPPKEFHKFIGLVNYYRYMRKIGSHTLEYLTKSMLSKLKFKWNEVKQRAFEEIKRIVARNILLACTNFNR